MTADARDRRRAPPFPVPWVTLTFVLISASLGLLPGLPESLQYDRSRVAGSAFWLPFTAQAVHWSSRMSIADLGTTLLLGSVIEARSRRLLLIVVMAGMLLVGAGLHLLAPAVAVYRGASGVASALFVALAIDLALVGEAPAAGAARFRRPIAWMALVLFAVKVVVEMTTGSAYFAGTMEPGVRVLPLAHLLGAVAGSVVVVTERATRSQSRTGPAEP
ncbi:MAG TPA: rhomboid family intramembrane serine protease [Candidatus Polarisedimenticolia bacterium]|nr:rhomboid family intramembrane serine protease [Candidatus Polarisedimenticolia bacterium]